MLSTGETQGGAVNGTPGRGALIVFEGGDRCGKTTQTQLLVKCLEENGVKAKLWRWAWCPHPSNHPTGTTTHPLITHALAQVPGPDDLHRTDDQ